MQDIKNELETNTNKNELNVITDANTMQKELNKLKEMSLSEIDKYGSDIQKMISDKSCEILEKTQMNELTDIRDGIEELNEVASKQKSMIPVLKTPIRKLKHFKNGFEKIQNRIDDVTKSLENQSDLISKSIEDMSKQCENIEKAVNELRIKEDSLVIYSEELKEDTDGIRLQAVSNRLSLISGTRVNAEQAQLEALMIIKSQQESKYQLEKVIQNVIPILRMQAVNAIGIKVNKETLKIMKKTREVTGKIIEKNAQDVKDMVTELQSNRTSGVIDENKLLSAQNMLNEALEIVAKASETEASNNIRIAQELRETAKGNTQRIKELNMMLGDKNE